MNDSVVVFRDKTLIKEAVVDRHKYEKKKTSLTKFEGNKAKLCVCYLDFRAKLILFSLIFSSKQVQYLEMKSMIF